MPRGKLTFSDPVWTADAFASLPEPRTNDQVRGVLLARAKLDAVGDATLTDTEATVCLAALLGWVNDLGKLFAPTQTSQPKPA